MKLSDKILIVPIILLGLNLVYRLIDSAKMIWQFPFDAVNDFAAYIALLHFFDLYGYMGTVPEWYNGFTLFATYPPGWVFFTYPIYLVTEHLLLSAYLSIIFLFILGFIGIWLIGRELKLSKVKIVAFFLFVFANPMSIGAVLKQGRLPSFLGLVLVVYIVYICLCK